MFLILFETFSPHYLLYYLIKLFCIHFNTLWVFSQIKHFVSCQEAWKHGHVETDGLVTKEDETEVFQKNRIKQIYSWHCISSDDRSANGTQLYATSACLYNREWLRGQKHGSCADAFVRVHDDFGEVMRAVGVSGCLGSPRQRDDAGFKSYTRRRLTVLGLWSGMYLSLCAFTFTFPSFLLSGSRMPAWPPLALFLVPFPCGHCLPEGLGKTHGIVTHRRDSVKWKVHTTGRIDLSS